MSTTAPTVVRNVGDLRTALSPLRSHGARPESRVGFVPTMGYLHDGHASLVRRARAECGTVVVSVFVNPLQFGPGEDFTSYPRDLDRDLAMLTTERADLVFVPEATEFYPPGADTVIVAGAIAQTLEGAERPGHFRGVATVVTMLFNAVQPHAAYFGEKDWQQLQIVRQCARDLHVPVEIVAVPTVRESDGLAMSSRNVRLTPTDRASALCVPRALEAARTAFAAGEASPDALERAMAGVIGREEAATADYAVVRDGETLRPVQRAEATSRALVAVRIGSVRLIDNCAL